MEEKMPLVEVTKEVNADYAHRLVEYDGKCSKIHGHHGRILITLEGPIDEKEGMVCDFSIIKKILNEEIVEVLDHNLLNEVIPELKKKPTAELTICWIWKTLKPLIPKLKRVTFYETPTSYATIENPSDEEIEYALKSCSQ